MAAGLSTGDVLFDLSEAEVSRLCPQPAKGPLDHFREQASFSWRELRLLTHRPELLDVKMRIWNLLEKEPIFNWGPELTLEQYRDVTGRRLLRLLELNPLPDSEVMSSPLKSMALVSALGMYDWSLLAKKMLLREFFLSSISGGGTDRHKHLLKMAASNQFTGTFCLTEISHGTNTKGMGTTATYCKERQQFILHTPDFASAKCWAGNLAKTATHASVFAQLFTEDGKCHGLHNFVVPIRNPANLQVYPGVIIGDMGHKIGLNGLDNGWLMFSQYPIDREMLLNKTGDVTPQGEYVTPFKDPSKRFGASLGNLSGGRVGIINMANTNLHMAIIIAIRYSAARKQFGPEGEEEWSVLRYQTQYRRLMPYLAACFALHYFSMTFFEDFVRLMAGRLMGEDPGVLADLGMEIHGVSSAGKPLASWTAQRAVQEAREACGGHGYLKVSKLGRIRDDNDANCTYEGDNNVLLQQTSNWLLQMFGSKSDRTTPAGTLDWTKDWRQRAGPEFPANYSDFNSDSAVAALRLLVVRLVSATQKELDRLTALGHGKFLARECSQFHLARTLAIVFVQSVVVQRFNDYAKSCPSLPILTHLSGLYSLWSLEELGQDLLIHGVLLPSHLQTIREKVLELSSLLVPESVALTDVLSPPDAILNSALGHSSGNVYQLLQQSFLETPGGFNRAECWDKYTETFRSKL